MGGGDERSPSDMAGSGSEEAPSEARSSDHSTQTLGHGSSSGVKARAEGRSESAPPVARVFTTGAVVANRYRIDRLIGRGGMGEVYEAHDRTLGLSIALKTLRLERLSRGAGIDELKGELALARRVTHTGVARVFDFAFHGGNDGIAFLTMELLTGQSLAERIRDGGPLAVEEVLRLADELCDGLAALHDVGIVHRDFKSSNVLLVDRADREVRAVITDFGLAVHEAQSLGERRWAGTPAFMAPEQVRGAEVSPRTDLYALGIVLFEMLTGTRPFDGDTPEAIAERRLNAPIPDVRALRGDVPKPLSALVSRLLAKEPRERPSSARDVKRLVQEVRRAPRRKLVRFALGITMAALAVAAGNSIYSAQQDRLSAQAFAGVRPLVLVAPLLGSDSDGAHVAETMTELLATELRIGDAFRTPAPNTRAAMMESLAFSDVPTRDQLAAMRSRTHVDVVTSGRVQVRGNAIDIVVRIDDVAKGTELGRVKVSGTPGDLLSMARDLAIGVRRKLGRGALTAEEADALKSVLPRDATSARNFVDGVTAQRRFRFVDAASKLEKVVASEPTFAPALALLAHAYMSIGRDADAVSAAKRAVENVAGLPRADELAILGLYAQTRKAWPEAVVHYQALATFYPDRIDHVTSLGRAYVNAGKPAEGVRVLEAALVEPGSDWDRMQVELMITYAYSRSARDADATRSAMACIELARALRAPVQLAHGLIDLADIYVREAKYEQVLPLLAEARATFIDVGDAASIASCDEHEAHVRIARGELDRAVELMQHSLATVKQLGHRYLIAHKTVALGIVQSQVGKHVLARASFEQASSMWREVNDQEGVAHGYLNTAFEDLELGRFEGVEERIVKGRQLHQSVGMTRGVAESFVVMGLLCERQGRLAEAETQYALAQSTLAGVTGASLLADAAFGRVRVALLRDDKSKGARIEEARAAATLAADPVVRTTLQVLFVRSALAKGDFELALLHAREGEKAANESHAPDAIARAASAWVDVAARKRGALDAATFDEATKRLAAIVATNEAIDVVLDAELSLSRAMEVAAVPSRSEALEHATRARTLAETHGFRVREWEAALREGDLAASEAVRARTQAAKTAIAASGAKGLLALRY